MIPPYAEIIPLGTRIDSEMTYGVPDDLRQGPAALKPGHRVLIPLGTRWTTGIVTGFADRTELPEVRQVAMPLDAEPVLSPSALELCRWIAGYYLCSLAEVLSAALPPGIHVGSGQRLDVAPGAGGGNGALSPRQQAIVTCLLQSGPLSLRQIERRVAGKGVRAAACGLVRRGVLTAHQAMAKPRARALTERVVHLLPRDPAWLETELPALGRRAPAQARCVTLLSGAGGSLPARDLFQEGIGASVVRALCGRHILKIEAREVRRDPYAGRDETPEDLTPTPAQEAVLSALLPDVDQGLFRVHLIHGVTGSGKTLVYVRAVARALSRGRGAIVLIPEIALTPQTVRRFRAHFGDAVAVLHSRLSAGERFDAWRDLCDGRRTVAIGPRSAVFAPVRDLGLIIVDEEHEGSYKQEDHRPYYHARDVAAVRARLEGCPVLLGSATPSVESYHNARAGKYRLLSLPARIDSRPLPAVVIADLHEERGAVIGKELRLRLRDRLGRGEQVILLQNRRGYAPYVQCASCGKSLDCPHCSVTLTYHRQGRKLVCHYCGTARPMGTACPSCKGSLDLRGVGTQRVEEVLREQFPEARVLRMDVDTTRAKGGHESILDAFRAHQADILLGTQMIAKGLDFPDVTLVGVILADHGMSLPDFRAGERTFQLLTQVAGRAGRGERPGEVVIQTFQPQNEAVACARDHDYDRFFAREIEQRRQGFPPFHRLARLLFSGPAEPEVARAAGECADGAREAPGGFLSVLGPAQAPLARIGGRFRWHVMLASPSHGDLGRAARAAMDRFGQRGRRAGVRLDVDIDPVSVL